MKTLRLVRHAESLANIGEPTIFPQQIPLSAKGLEQSLSFAERINVAPDLIVLSPFKRAQQTAEPLITKFPDVKVVSMDIQEFTFLALPHGEASTVEGRRPLVEAYWERADTEYRAGDGAESLSDLIKRADDFLANVTKLEDNNIVAFTHEQFIKAVIWRICGFEPGSGNNKATAFRSFIESYKVPNIAYADIQISDEKILFGGIFASLTN